MNILSRLLKNFFCRTDLQELVKIKSLELEKEIARLEQVEKEFAHIVARKRAIFDAQPDATIISDRNGLIVLANKQVERLLGYSSSELIGHPIEMLIPSRFHEKHLQYRESYCRSPYVRLMGVGLATICALSKDGIEIDAEISLSPIKTEQGLLFASSLRDVTERRKMELALKESEERFRLMANSSPIMIWITDKEVDT